MLGALDGLEYWISDLFKLVSGVKNRKAGSDLKRTCPII
jgi:hypothetical protein